VARVFLGDKGPAYYATNSLFWAKMAVFALVGAISIMPTLKFLRWRREGRADPHFRPDVRALVSVRRALFAEAGLVALLPILAAGMARGIGS
jgi:putative membrane protein